MRSSPAETRGARRAYRAVLLAIVVFAAVVRVYDLGNLPAGLFCDEADNGYKAYSILKTGEDESRQFLPLYVWSFGVSYKNPVFIYSRDAADAPVRSERIQRASDIGAVRRSRRDRPSPCSAARFSAPSGGLIAALLLARLPWHVHFSRIAFELIAFPAALSLRLRRPGAPACAGGRSPGRRWPGSLRSLPLRLRAGQAVHAAVPARRRPGLQRRLWAVRRVDAARCAAGAADRRAGGRLRPAALANRSQQYFARTTTLNAKQSVRDNAERVVDQYERFFSVDFLFEHGDPLLRHSVPGFGELYWSPCCRFSASGCCGRCGRDTRRASCCCGGCSSTRLLRR